MLGLSVPYSSLYNHLTINIASCVVYVFISTDTGFVRMLIQCTSCHRQIYVHYVNTTTSMLWKTDGVTSFSEEYGTQDIIPKWSNDTGLNTAICKT